MLKSEIRKALKEKRKTLSFEEKNSYSQKITQAIVENFNLDSKVISVFLPIEKLNEVNTAFLIEYLKKANAIISSPVSDFKNLELKHVLHDDKTLFEINEWGIPEPVNGNEIKPEEFDYVFVPLLAINKTGYRVGYGKGFYDRFLSRCGENTVFIGLNYFDDLLHIEDINEDDVPVHFVVTPNKIIEF